MVVDDRLVCSCLVLAASAVGSEITTVEGLTDDGTLSDVQQAFVTEGAVQCGFCTPGLVVAVHDLLERNPKPDSLAIREALSGNLCRCTGYGRIFAAVETAIRDRARRGVTDTRVGNDRTAFDRAASDRAVLGTSPTRPDGIPKVQGRFAFSSDLWAEGMVWGRTLRSPHPHARITRLDVSPAWRIPGVEVIVTAADVPGATYGLISADQPVFASDTILYAGQAVAAVAADHPETARRACEAIVVEYEALDPVTDPERAIEAPPLHPDGNVFRHQRIECGEEGVVGDVVVEGTYEIGMQDQAFLGLESALALPDSDGKGVELFISTQWLHEDRRQIADCLGLPEERVRLQLAGVGGAFGAREDVSLQVHVCLLALRTGRPVKMMYGRDESFLGHVHRHPGRIWMRHHARADGTLVNLECRVILDGGAYASTSSAVLINAITHVQGPVPPPACRASTAGPCARTTRLAARCAGSACSRRASPTRARWTSSQRRADSTRSRSGSGTRSRPATPSSPARCSRAWLRRSAACGRPPRCRCRLQRTTMNGSAGPAALDAPLTRRT